MSTDRTQFVSIAEAARRLTAEGDAVERSTLSRYVTRYADALRPARSGRDTLVDFEALRRHRRENIALPARLERADAEPYREARSAHAAKHRKEEADATLREIELERALGTVCPVSEVERAAQDAVAILAAEEDRQVTRFADLCARATGADSRVVRKFMRELMHSTRATFAAALLARIPGAEAPAPAGEASEAANLVPAE